MTTSSPNTHQDDEAFENEVRRIARQLWPSAQYSGAAIVDGKERDGVFETEECLHLLEATTSRRKEKAVQDVNKLFSLGTKRQRHASSKAVRCWLITKSEPTAEQRSVVARHRPLVTILSFAQFQLQLVDSKAYLQAREDYPFGSVRDPITGKSNPQVAYIKLLLSDIVGQTVRTLGDIVEGLKNGGRYTILGDYGAGKSMTLRQIYHDLRASHLKGDTPYFPIYINLRDHYGQTEPAELIERHARIVGFAAPSHLVRAWRAGYVHLLLDGFDEVTTLNVQGLWKKLRDHRFRAMEAVRRLVRDHSQRAGIVLAGRAHFFDSSAERSNALGLQGKFTEFLLNEFTDAQIADYLQKSGSVGSVPLWLPSRPLLVAYLASKDLLDPDLDNREPADGWDRLLDRIASREAEIEAGIDGSTVRRILERLATRARESTSGLGPLSQEALLESFSQVCGYSPDERGMVLLQRLPGLGIDRDDENTRVFVDEDFADACRAGDLVAIVESPFTFDASAVKAIECSIGSLGTAVAANYIRRRGYTSGKLNAALAQALNKSQDYVVADIVRLMMEGGYDVAERIDIRGVYISELELSERIGNVSQVTFKDCFFGRVVIDTGLSAEVMPNFHGCYVSEIDGRLSRADLPQGVFDEDSVVESFSSTGSTTAGVLALDLPLGVRVLLTVLKKLYQRRGSGRRENALSRGLDHRARRVVPDVLELLRREGLASPYRRGESTIWLPDRESVPRVGRIIAAPTSSSDSILRSAADLEA